ncbi:NO-inducible flavohemoprotein [Pontibacillus litoralis]|uniref:Flavohemoprotein n=1 Tax=Pontibacillus litoralis JSM 072002 TaxID=1385512 RepID=A0A0A5HPU8_9BACI|nr:NO-inducible flavohemoprotein [Pontibacillus litoralis]KGX85657.1 dihydropteridine reductase [Pontibacillus litoralis JSM 072002]
MGSKTKQVLDEQTIAIVKSTVPVLAEHGEAITKRFYELMFQNHPELKNIFNQTNQRLGKQPKALANTVFAAANYIDQLDAIYPVVKQIGHKHRSLNVKPEQYPIVGEHLLLAMKDVLGDAATDEVIHAWGIAYGVIADVFIQVEKEMYQEVTEAEGGWNGFKDFEIVQKVKESDVITSFYLKPVDGDVLPAFSAGQYITVKVTVPGYDYVHLRQYSLSVAPGGDYYRISVKKEGGTDHQPAGVVSTYLHESINVGNVLPITAPAGDFILNKEEEKPLVLISGGVGLTPLVSMLETTIKTQPKRAIYFIHAAQNGKVQAFQEKMNEWNKLEQVHVFTCYHQPTAEDRANNNFDKEGLIDLAWLQSILPSNDGDYYLCGPGGFMKHINQCLTEWNVPQTSIHHEFFGPEEGLA